MRRRPTLIIAATSVAYTLMRGFAVREFLPKTLVSHWGAGGQADGFMPRDQFLWLYLGLLLVVLGLLYGSARFIHKIPVGLLNLPDKQKWVQSGRLDEARSLTADGLFEIGASTSVLLAAIFELSLRSNLGNGSLNGTLVSTMLLGYFAHVIYVIVKLTRRLRFPATE